MRQSMLVIAGCFLAAVCVAEPQTNDIPPIHNEDQARALADQALELVVAGDFDSAFGVLKPHWPLPQSEIDMLVMQTVKQRGMAESRFGKSLGYELVKSERISESLLRLTYLEIVENTPIRWRFLFYRPDDVWQVNAVLWDDQVIGMCSHDR